MGPSGWPPHQIRYNGHMNLHRITDTFYKIRYKELRGWHAQVYSPPIQPGYIYTTLINLGFTKSSMQHDQPHLLPFIVKTNYQGHIVRATPTVCNVRNINQLHNGQLYATYTTGISSMERQVSHTAISPQTLWPLSDVPVLRCVNKAITDTHDYLLLKNGNWLLVGYRLESLPKHHPSGHRHIAHQIIQEITPDHVLVWEWSSKNNIQQSDRIDPDAVGIVDQPQYDVLDYMHVNAVMEDSDGDIIVSGKFTSQLIKINRDTGEIIWRMGGTRNEFTFIDDPYDGFSGQHTPSRTPTGTILLYDNGTLRTPQQTRMTEYELDEENKTARLVWSYEQPGRYTPATGSVQRLPNGNTLIGWGKEQVQTGKPKITEIDPNGNTVMEIITPANYGSYRAYKWTK